MPVYNPKRLTRPETLRKIDRRSLLALLRQHEAFFVEQGVALPAARDAQRLDLDAVAKVLAVPDLHPPGALADALFYVNELSTRDGMDALLMAIDPRELNLDPAVLTPADVAVRAWLRDSRLLERTYAELLACRPRRFEYFRGLDDPPRQLADPADERLAPLEAHLNAVFAAKGRGRGGVRIAAYPQADECLFMVRHGDARRREGALEGSRETSVLYRPLLFDVVGYSRRWGTLRVYARTKWEVSLYRNAFGRFLFGSMDYFHGTGRYTLAPLHGWADACVACQDVPPLKWANLVEVHLYWGGVYDALEVYKATDVLAALRERGTKGLEVPRIKEAVFELYRFGEDNAFQRVTVIPPNVARYAREAEADLADRWLAARGFIRGAQEDAREPRPASLFQVPGVDAGPLGGVGGVAAAAGGGLAVGAGAAVPH